MVEGGIFVMLFFWRTRITIEKMRVVSRFNGSFHFLLESADAQPARKLGFRTGFYTCWPAVKCDPIGGNDVTEGVKEVSTHVFPLYSPLLEDEERIFFSIE